MNLFLDLSLWSFNTWCTESLLPQWGQFSVSESAASLIFHSPLHDFELHLYMYV